MSETPNERSVFVDALDVLPGEARATFLDRACGEDTPLRRRVEALLAAHDNADSFLDRPAVSPAPVSGSHGRPGELLPRIPGYRVVGRLGAGGMGVVWRAVQIGTERPVALKMIGPADLGSTRARARFLREVELTANLEHPNIARVYEGGEGDGVCFCAMELIDGVPLDRFVTDHCLPPRDVVALVAVVCRAVEHAHQKGVIHRDLKPANILVDGAGVPHVLDFGLAKTMDGSGPAGTSLTGEVAGTPAFMSPEQAAGQPVDTRSDVYSLGVVLFRLRTGAFPHDTQGSMLDVIRRIADDEPRRLRDAEPRADPELDAIVGKALAREPQRRYGTAGGLAADLDRYLAGEPLEARPPTLGYLLRKRARRHRAALAVVATLAGLLAVAAVWDFARVARERNAAVRATAAAVAAGQEAERQRAVAVSATGHERAAKVEAQGQAEAARRELYFEQLALADAARGQGNLLRAREILRDCPEDLRGWEWHHLRRRAAEEAFPIRTAAPATGLCFSPVSDLLAVSAGADVELWDFNDWGADGSPAAPVGTRTLDGPVTALAWSPDGARVAAATTGGQVWTWNPYAPGENPAAVAGLPAGDVTALAFTPDGARLAVLAAAGRVLLADLTGRTPARPLAPPGGERVTCVAVSSDGRLLAGGLEGGPIQLWNLADGHAVRAFPSNEPYLRRPVGVAFLDGGGVASATVYGSVVAVDRESGRRLWRAEVPGTRTASLAGSGDGRSLALGFEAGAVVLDGRRGGMTRVAQTASREPARLVALSRDGQLLAAAFLGRAVSVRMVGGQPAERALEPAAAVRSVVLALAHHNGTGRLAYAAGADTHVVLIDRDGGKHLLGPKPLANAVRAIAWAPAGDRLACATGGGAVVVYQIPSGQVIRAIEAAPAGTPAADLRYVALAAAGECVIAASDGGRVAAWGVPSGDLKWALEPAGPSTKTLSMIGCPDDREFVLCRSGREGLTVRGAADGRVLRPLRNDLGTPRRSLAFSPAGDTLYGGNGDRVAAFAWPSGESRWTSASRANLIESHGAAVSPDGRRLATVHQDRLVRLWDTASGRRVLPLPGAPSGAIAVVWSAGGADLVASVHDAARGGLVTWHGAAAAATAPVPGASPAAWVQLLPTVDPRADALRGHWAAAGGSLESDNAAPATLAFRYTPPAEYDYRVEFERLSGSDAVAQILLDHGAGFEWCMGARGGTLSYIGAVAGLRGWDCPTAKPTTPADGAGRHVSLVKVRRGDVAAYVDGRLVSEWETDGSDLSPPSDAPKESGRPFLGLRTVGTPTRFNRAEVLESPEGDRPEVAPPDGHTLVGPGAVVDLLAVSAAVEASDATWADEGPAGRVLRTDGRFAHIDLPVAPRGGYELTAVFRRSGYDAGVAFVLPHPGGRVAAEFDTYRQFTSLSMVGGRAVHEKGFSFTRLGRVLENGRAHTVVLRVEPQPDSVRITAALDGRELYRWDGPAADLSLPSAWEAGRRLAVGCAGGTTVAFDRLDVRILQGDAAVFRAPLRPPTSRPTARAGGTVTN